MEDGEERVEKGRGAAVKTVKKGDPGIKTPHPQKKVENFFPPFPNIQMLSSFLASLDRRFHSSDRPTAAKSQFVRSSVGCEKGDREWSAKTLV